MKEGPKYQYARFEEMRDEGRLDVETLGETGCWYKQMFAETPASAIAAMDDRDGSGRRSVWYSSKTIASTYTQRTDASGYGIFICSGTAIRNAIPAVSA